MEAFSIRGKLRGKASEKESLYCRGAGMRNRVIVVEWLR